MKNKSVLLLDASGASYPIRVALENMGCSVFSLGAKPSQFQARLAETHFLVDYRDLNALSKILDETNCDFVVPGCTDLSFKSYASLNERFRLLDQETIGRLIGYLNKKDLFETLERLGLPSLSVIREDVLSGEISGSVIIKPADAYSGRGIEIHEVSHLTEDRLNTALSEVGSQSTDGRALIERYLDADLFSMSLFSDGSRILVSPVLSEQVNAEHRVVVSRLASGDVMNQKSVKRLIDSICDDLGFSRWFLHVQFLMDSESGFAYIIDCAARCPGDYYGVLVEMGSGFPYVENYARVFSGAFLSSTQALSVDRQIVRKTFHGFDAIYGAGVDCSGDQMLAFYPDMDWPGDSSARAGVAFIRSRRPD